MGERYALTERLIAEIGRRLANPRLSKKERIRLTHIRSTLVNRLAAAHELEMRDA